jgi:O-antigen/teichoic acid export membrane protein
MFKNMLHSLLTKGGVAAINFLLLVVSARYLGASSRGEISIFVLNIAVIQVVNEIYTGYTLLYFVPRFSLKKLFITGLIYTLAVCSLCNGALAATQQQVRGFEWLGYLVALLVILNTFNCVLILGKEQVKVYNFLSLLQPFLLLLGLLYFIFVLRDMTFRAYVYPLLLSFVISLLVSGTVVARIIYSDEEAKPFALRPVLTSGLLYQGSLLMYLFCKRYSYYLLADRAEVGLYSSAVTLMESVLIISAGILPALLARIANQQNTSENARMVLSISKICLGVSLLAALLVCLLPAQLYVYALGPPFAGIRRLMILYAPAVLAAAFSGIVSGYFLASGKQGVVLTANSVGFVLTLVIAPFLANRYHADGAAYAAIITYLAIALVVGVAFFRMNRLPLSRLFSMKEDFCNLKMLIPGKRDPA